MQRIDLDEKNAAEIVKKAIDIAMPSARAFVSIEHCQKVARELYASKYRISYVDERPEAPK